MLFAGGFCLYKMELIFDIKYILLVFSNGLKFYVGLWLNNIGLKYVTNSQISGIAYLSIILIFGLDFIFFGEQIFLTDIIGCLLILSFNVFNTLKPVS